MEPGRNNDARGDGVSATSEGGSVLGALLAFGRMAGFLLLTLPALATIAVVAVVPKYVESQVALHQQACAQAAYADLGAVVATTDLLLAEAPDNEVFYQRVMLAQTNRLPLGQTVIPSAGGRRPLTLAAPAKHPRPPAPSGLAFDINKKLENKSFSRGLFLLAIGAIATAMFLFAPPDRGRRQAVSAVSSVGQAV